MDRCGKLSSWQGPEFPQAGHGFAPGSVKIEPDPDPPDEALGPLRGPGERGVDEVAVRLEDDSGRGFESARLLLLLHLVAQPFVLMAELSSWRFTKLTS